MENPSQTDPVIDRIAMVFVGASAGLSFWLFNDILPDLIQNKRLYLFLTALTFGFFSVVMLLGGPIRLFKSLLAAFCISLPASLLIFWYSFRFEHIDNMFKNAHQIVVFIALIIVTTPFAAATIQQKQGWRRYSLLFDLSWLFVVRFLAASIFTGIFWAILLLSHEFLEIVGISIIEDLIDIDWMPALLSGAVFGLALAVVNELSDYLSPLLIIRLLRLLLPVVLLVIAIFIVAAPLRGLSNLFGVLSSAATLIAMAWAAITLITTSVDRSDKDAAQNRFLRLAAMFLAALLPAIAFMSAYAIWVRISQYGPTPDRIVASAMACFISIYSILYWYSLMHKKNWMTQIRRTNRRMAMLLIAVCALWLTPLINLERLSTKAQITRFEKGLTEVNDLPLWEMAHEWGKAGLSGIETLRQNKDHAEYDALVLRIDKAISIESKYRFNNTESAPETQKLAGDLLEHIALRPVGSPRPEGFFDMLRPFQVTQISDGCARKLADGRAACVMIMAPFYPSTNQPQGLILYLTAENRVSTLFLGGVTSRLPIASQIFDLNNGKIAELPPETISQALDGAFSIAPAPLNMLKFDEINLFPYN